MLTPAELQALVFGLGHNGMAVYHADERPDFWKLQVSSNISTKVKEKSVVKLVQKYKY
jgi:hypothetical protein